MTKNLQSFARVVALGAAFSVLPGAAHAQSGKWTGLLSQLQTVNGAAEVSVENKDEKNSKAKISFRNTKRETRLAWDIVAGRCRDEGVPVAPGAIFRRIQTSMDGSGTTTVNIPKLETGKNYYFRVYDPQSVATDAQAYGCANLSEVP